MSFLNNNFISEFFVQVMYWLNDFVNHYWLTIIILTIAVRVILLPLDIKQRRSSRIMQELSAEADALKKRYANDPQILQKKISELYKKNGAGQFSGCLPMIVMMILLCAFYGAIRVISTNESFGLLLSVAQNDPANVDLPQFLWIRNFWQPDSGMSTVLPDVNMIGTFVSTNLQNMSPESLTLLRNFDIFSFSQSGVLSVNDTVVNSLTQGLVTAKGIEGNMNGWFILPIISGGLLFFTQYYSMKKNPQQMQQMKFMLYFFPLFSVYICIISSSAFAIYWIASSLYALVQTVLTDKILSGKSFVKKKPAQIK